MYVNNRHWGISIKFHFLLKYIWLGDKKKKYSRESIYHLKKKLRKLAKVFLHINFNVICQGHFNVIDVSFSYLLKGVGCVLIEGRDSFIFRQIWIVLVHIDNRNTKGSQFQSDTQLSSKPLYLFSGLSRRNILRSYIASLHSFYSSICNGDHCRLQRIKWLTTSYLYRS